MSDYWKELYTNAVQDNPSSEFRQVGKTVNGVEVGSDQLELIIAHIGKKLSLNKSDVLADFGCGNGVITVRLAKKVSSIVGIDYTNALLSHAEQHNSSENVVFRKSDLTRIDLSMLNHVNKLIMYEVLQHMSLIDFSELIEKLTGLSKCIQFFVGGIPDKQKINKFYDTKKKMAYHLKCERDGRPHLGRWWLRSELQEIALSWGWQFIEVEQPQGLYTAHYRFDALLIKQ